MLGKGHGFLYKAPAKEEAESERRRGERDKIKLIGRRFEREPVVGLSE